jgi:HPt (histidine-containing phosphotransfer) domain-containing protein
VSEVRVWQAEAIENLRDQLGDDDGVMVREIIKVYLVQARELLAQMQVAARESDEYQLRGLAHSLKGSSATVGGGRLAAACDRLEHGSPAELASPQVCQSAMHEFELLAAELVRYRPLRRADSTGCRDDMTRDQHSAGRFGA